MDYEELMETTFTGAQIEAGANIVATLLASLVLLVLFLQLAYVLIRYAINRFAEKINGYHRLKRKWYLDDLPVKKCPICQSRARIRFTNKRFRQGFIYCPHCYIRTNEKEIREAVNTWNALGEQDIVTNDIHL